MLMFFQHVYLLVLAPVVDINVSTHSMQLTFCVNVNKSSSPTVS